MSSDSGEQSIPGWAPRSVSGRYPDGGVRRLSDGVRASGASWELSGRRARGGRPISGFMNWTTCFAGPWLGSLIKAMGNRIGLGDAVTLSMLTQASKYLPGNVFHLAGRVWLARKFGIERKLAALATAGEMGLLVFVAIVIGLPWLLQHVALPWLGIALGGLIVLALLALAGVWFKKNQDRAQLGRVMRGPGFIGWLFLSIAAYAVFLHPIRHV